MYAPFSIVIFPLLEAPVHNRITPSSNPHDSREISLQFLGMEIFPNQHRPFAITPNEQKTANRNLEKNALLERTRIASIFMKRML